jgi:hypothetical protein
MPDHESGSSFDDDDNLEGDGDVVKLLQEVGENDISAVLREAYKSKISQASKLVQKSFHKVVEDAEDKVHARMPKQESSELVRHSVEGRSREALQGDVRLLERALDSTKKNLEMADNRARLVTEQWQADKVRFCISSIRTTHARYY